MPTAQGTSAEEAPSHQPALQHHTTPYLQQVLVLCGEVAAQRRHGGHAHVQRLALLERLERRRLHPSTTRTLE